MENYIPLFAQRSQQDSRLHFCGRGVLVCFDDFPIQKVYNLVYFAMETIVIKLQKWHASSSIDTAFCGVKRCDCCYCMEDFGSVSYFNGIDDVDDEDFTLTNDFTRAKFSKIIYHGILDLITES